VVDSGEQCDDGAANSNTAANVCRLDCTPPRCGDGVVDTGEQCDAGAANSNTVANACRLGCTPARCGDGVTDTGEECDDGNSVDNDNCTNTCDFAGVLGAACNAPIDLNASGTLSGRTTRFAGTNTDGGFSAGSDCGGASGVEKVHVYRTAVRANVVITTEDPATTIDSIVYVRSVCTVFESGRCDDNAGAGNTSLLTLNDVAAGTVLFVFVDAPNFTGGNLGPYGLLVTEQPIRASGESCDPAGVADRCDAGLLCLGSLCTAATPPTVADVDAFDLGGGRVRVVVSGGDANADAAAMETTFLDATGASIGSPDFFTPGLTPNPAGLTSYRVKGEVSGLSGRGAAQVRVQMRDTTGLRSTPPVVALIGALPVRAPDAACDTEAFVDRCADGLRCEGTAPTPGVCRPIPGYGCAGAIDLNTAGTRSGNTWTYTGSNGQSALSDISTLGCGGAGLDVYHVYTLPERADVTFTTQDAGTLIDTVLYVRTVCTNAATELACNNDIRAGLSSSTVTLSTVAAGVTLSVVVDTANFGVGAYVLKTTLTSIRSAGQGCDATGATSRCEAGLICLGNATCGTPTAPVLTRLDAVRLDSTRVRLVVDGQDVDGDARGLRVQARNTPGDLVDFDGDGSTAAVFRFFATPVTGTTTPFVASVTLSGLGGQDLASFDVSIEDAQALTSSVATAALVPLPVRVAGAACDGRELRDTCEAGSSCEDDGGGSFVCTLIPGGSCARPIDLGAEGTVSGNQVSYSATNLVGQTGQVGSCGGAGFEMYHEYTMPFAGDLTISTDSAATTFDTVLYVQTTCGGSATEIACAVGGGARPGTSTLVLGDVSAGLTVAIIVDAVALVEVGSYELTLTTRRILGTGEACTADVTAAARCGTGLVCEAGGAAGATVCLEDRAIVLNEVLYDGADLDADDAFTEIAGPPGYHLDGWTLVGIEGDTGVAYRTLDLTGAVIPADGLLVVATATAAGDALAARDFTADVDWGNGPGDAVQLRDAGGVVVDAVQYGTAAVGNAGEGSPATDVTAARSLSRDANHTDTQDNATDFAILTTPTPGAP
jgi:cysteine-rich repeat protein